MQVFTIQSKNGAYQTHEGQGGNNTVIIKAGDHVILPQGVIVADLIRVGNDLQYSSPDGNGTTTFQGFFSQHATLVLNGHTIDANTLNNTYNQMIQIVDAHGHVLKTFYAVAGASLPMTIGEGNHVVVPGAHTASDEGNTMIRFDNGAPGIILYSAPTAQEVAQNASKEGISPFIGIHHPGGICPPQFVPGQLPQFSGDVIHTLLQSLAIAVNYHVALNAIPAQGSVTPAAAEAPVLSEGAQIVNPLSLFPEVTLLSPENLTNNNVTSVPLIAALAAPGEQTNVTPATAAELPFFTHVIPPAPPTPPASSLDPIPNQTTPVLVQDQFTAAVTNPNPAIVFSLAGTVPQGATINSSTGVVSWVPSNSQESNGPNVYTFDVQAQLNGSNISHSPQAVDVTVTGANPAPTVADYTIYNDTGGTIVIPYEAFQSGATSNNGAPFQSFNVVSFTGVGSATATPNGISIDPGITSVTYDGTLAFTGTTSAPVTLTVMSGPPPSILAPPLIAVGPIGSSIAANNSVLIGTSGSEHMTSDQNNTYFIGNGGSDTYGAVMGNDTVSYMWLTSGNLTVNMPGGTATYTGGTDTFLGSPMQTIIGFSSNGTETLIAVNSMAETLNPGNPQPGATITLIGGANENDTFIYSNLLQPGTSSHYEGGASGSNTLVMTGSLQNLDLVALNNAATHVITNIETIDLTGAGHNSLTITPAQVPTLSPTTDTVTVVGDNSDTVNANDTSTPGTGWTANGTTVIGGVTYNQYIDTATHTMKLNIDAAISTHLNVHG